MLCGPFLFVCFIHCCFFLIILNEVFIFKMQYLYTDWLGPTQLRVALLQYFVQ